MTEPNRQDREQSRDNQDAPYPSTGHPSVEQLTKDQGTGPVADVNMLRGGFWPEEESIDDFLATLHEWRGHLRTDPAA